MMGLGSRSGRAKTAALDSRNLWGNIVAAEDPDPAARAIGRAYLPLKLDAFDAWRLNAPSLAKSILLFFLTYFSTLF